MDREKVIEHITDCVKIADCQINHNWVFVRTDILRDALALLKAQEPMVMAGAELTDAELIEEIRKAPFVLKPNVDAIPVVRCRDCKYWEMPRTAYGIKCGYCNNMHSHVSSHRMPEENYYCPHGERRESE